MTIPPRLPPTVILPLKQFGSLYVETIETRDPENEALHSYEYIWRAHRTVGGRVELRLARIREIDPPITARELQLRADRLTLTTEGRTPMKFDFHKFLAVVSQVGPMVLIAVPGGDKIATLIPTITHAIAEAEQIKGASGADKKQHVLEVVAAGVATANATGKVTLDPTEVAQIAGAGVDAVIGTVHVIEGATVVKAA